MQGFIVFDFIKEYAVARKQLAQWLEEGKIKRKQTVVKGGVAMAEQALVDLFDGKNIGKASFALTWTCKILLLLGIGLLIHVQLDYR